MRKYLIVGILLLILATPIVLAFLYRGGSKTPKDVTLNYWIVEDQEEDLEGLVSLFRTLHPYVNVRFRKFNINEYENALIQGWARDQGPDIFSLPSTWLKKYQEFITPMPSQTNVAYYETKKFLFRTSTDIIYQKKSLPTIREINNSYIDIISSSIILKDSKDINRVYALPYSVDTLALFYNKNLLNNAYIIEPAKTWQGLVNQSPKLTKLDEKNNIIESAIPLGLSQNINNSYDILSLLMMQNGARMISSDGEKVIFDDFGEGESHSERAVNFYISFTDINKETYSWNDKMSESLDTFKDGKSAYYIGYLSDKNKIDKLAPGLNYDVSHMLHINSDGTDRVLNRAGNPTQINYGKFWVETVSRKTKAKDEAWDLVYFIAKEKRNRDYINITGKISPLRSLLKEQIKNENLEIWASQALTAKNWYHGKNATATEQFINEMIESIALHKANVRKALNLAADKVEKTL